MKSLIPIIFVLSIFLILPVSAGWSGYTSPWPFFRQYDYSNPGYLLVPSSDQLCSADGNGYEKYTYDTTLVYACNMGTNVTNPSLVGVDCVDYGHLLYTTPGTNQSTGNYTPISNYFANTSYVFEAAGCSNYASGGGQTYSNYFDAYHTGTAPVSLIANFTISPGFTITRGTVANFTDTSTASNGENMSTWNWSFGDGSTATTALFSKYYASVGSYNVSLKVSSPSNSAGATAYHTLNVIAYNVTSNVTLNYDVRASDTGSLLAGASIGIQNTTDNIWRNSTSPTGLSYFTSTEPGNLYPLSVGQTVGLFAGMPGYQSSTENVTIPYDGYHAYQYLVPAGVVNATGAGTVVVNVVGNSNGIPISGASLTFDTGQLAITNTAGSATIYNVTAGNRTIQASAPNYQSAVTGAIITAGATNGVLIQLVGVGQTPVATYAPGVTTPVPTDTYGNPISGNTSSAAMNTTSSAGIITMFAELIQLWPLGVLLVVLKAIKAI